MRLPYGKTYRMQKINSLKKWFGKDAEPAKRRVVQAIKFGILICLFIGLFWIVPIADVLQVIKSANPALLLVGIALGLPKVYLNSVMLGLLTQKQGLRISYNRLFAVNMMVKFYMLFLPGAMIGSGIRWAKISPSGKSAESFAAVAFNRFLEIFLIIVTGLFWFLAGINQESFSIILLIIFVISMVLLWLIYIKVSLFLVDWFERKPTLPNRSSILQKVWNYLRKLVNSLSVYIAFSLKELLLLFGLGILSYFVGLASYVFIARSVDISVSIFDLGWIRSIILLAAYLPFSFAGGLGVREVSLVVLLATFGVEAEIALAFSLLIFIRAVVLSLIGGVLELAEVLQKRKAR
jgi:uncharacterized protein (TIRG00374 family)